MKALVCLMALLCCPNLAWPCANLHSSGTALSGGSTGATTPADRELRSAIRRNLQEEGRTIEAKLRGSTKFEDRSDYAVALMYLGRSSEAVELLQSLEREQPGDYSVAANLGTALELSGDTAGGVGACDAVKAIGIRQRIPAASTLSPIAGRGGQIGKAQTTGHSAGLELVVGATLWI